MRRRAGGKVASFRCGHQGCTESVLYGYSNRESAKRLDASYGNGRARCVRHTKPDEVLTLDNRKRSITRTLVLHTIGGTSSSLWPSREHGPPKPLGNFWKSSETDSGNGFAYGDGWKAWGRDFPAGTRIVVRVEVEAIVPDETEAGYRPRDADR